MIDVTSGLRHKLETAHSAPTSCNIMLAGHASSVAQTSPRRTLRCRPQLSGPFSRPARNRGPSSLTSCMATVILYATSPVSRRSMTTNHTWLPVTIQRRPRGYSPLIARTPTLRSSVPQIKEAGDTDIVDAAPIGEEPGDTVNAAAIGDEPERRRHRSPRRRRGGHGAMGTTI